MRNNCGIVAYDQLVGQLNGRTNNISLDTLAKIAQDNGFILFPMRLTQDRLKELRYPYIVHHNHHFECWESEAAVDGKIEEPFYVLSSQCIPELVVTETEARGVKGGDVGQMFTPPKSKSPWEAATSGSTGGWASFAGPKEPTNPQDPGGWGWVGPALTTTAGAIPGVGPLISAGMGASGAMGGGTGFQGTDKGWSNVGSTILGGLGGYGMGGLGSGLAGGLGGAGGGLSGMGQGFGRGIEQYFGTDIIPGVSGSNPTSWLGGTNAIPTSYGNMMQPLYGGAPAVTGQAALGGTQAGVGMGSAGGLGSLLSNLLGGGTTNTRMPTGAASTYTPGQTAANAGTYGAGDKTAGSWLNPQTLLGLGLMGASAIPKTAEYKSPGTSTPLGRAAGAELQRGITSNFGELYPDTSTDPYTTYAMGKMNEMKQRDIEALNNRYVALGMSNSGEHQQSLMDLEQQYAENAQGMLSEQAYNQRNQEIASRIQYLAQAQGMDRAQMDQLVTEAGIPYGADATSVNQIRQILGLGGIVAMGAGMGAF